MLLTSEEVGGDFVEEYRGKVTFDVAGSLCPAGREAAGEALEVLSSESTSGSASFVSPLPPEYTGAEPGDAVLQQQVLTADADEIEAGMAALRAGLAECYGTTWRVEDLEHTVEPLRIPDVGEESFGVLLRHFADIPTAYIRKGRIFMIVQRRRSPTPRVGEADRPGVRPARGCGGETPARLSGGIRRGSRRRDCSRSPSRGRPRKRPRPEERRPRLPSAGWPSCAT
jgi:hypothetical protein